jgi:hypothetical protein
MATIRAFLQGADETAAGQGRGGADLGWVARHDRGIFGPEVAGRSARRSACILMDHLHPAQVPSVIDEQPTVPRVMPTRRLPPRRRSGRVGAGFRGPDTRREGDGNSDGRRIA